MSNAKVRLIDNVLKYWDGSKWVDAAQSTDAEVTAAVAAHVVAAFKLIQNATDTISVAVADLGALRTTVIASVAGTAALAVPGAVSADAGNMLVVKKTGTVGAVTITPAAGTIAGGATHAALDAQNDWAVFISDGTSDWLLVESGIS